MVTSGQVASIVCRFLPVAIARTAGAMPCAEKMSHGVVGNLVHLLDEAGALVAQLVDDVAVVDDLLAHVDRAVADLEGLLDDVDRAHDARAEAAQAGDEELLDAGCPEKSRVASPGHRLRELLLLARPSRRPALAEGARPRSG